MVKLQNFFEGKLFFAVGTANLMSLTTGMMLVWSSPIIPKLQLADENNPLSNAITSNEESWIASLFSLGAALGPFPAAYLQHVIGRKLTLVLTAICFIVSCFIAAFANVVWLFYLVRLVSGISAGAVFTVLPIYLAEVSTIRFRGMFGALLICFQSIGVLITYSMGPYLSIMLFNLLESIVPIIFLLLIYFIPESPYYLIQAKRRNDAENALAFLRSKCVKEIQTEVREIENSIADLKKSESKFFDIFKSRALTKAFIISVCLCLFSQLCGITIIISYTQNIFESAGVSMNSATPPIIIGAVQLLGSFITPIVVDGLGRKFLLLSSALGVTISLVPLGIYFHLQKIGINVDEVSWIPIVTLIIYTIAYNFGIGSLCWLIMAEILPSNLRVIVTPIAATSCFLIAYASSFSYNYLSEVIGIGGTFWICAGFSVISFLFFLLYVPETKGKSFQEIQRIL